FMARRMMAPPLRPPAHMAPERDCSDRTEQPSGSGRGIFEQFEPFAGDRVFENRKPGNIAPAAPNSRPALASPARKPARTRLAASASLAVAPPRQVWHRQR